MNRPKDTVLYMLLPLTLTAATALTIFAVIAFRMEANTEGFVFSFFSLSAWIALVSEFFLLYDSIIDKWLSKDRSVMAATWFLLSLLLSFILTPDKHLDWSTAIVMLSLFAVIFLLPYMVCMGYGRQISSFLLRLWNERVMKRKKAMEETVSKTEEAQTITPSSTPKSMSQEEEAAYYEKMVAGIPSDIKAQFPQPLQSEDALFLMLLLREGGFLDNELRPAIMKEDGEINQTLYAYIADAVCTALNIRQGKWKIFEKLWPINNGTQTVSRYKQETRDSSTQHQKKIARLLRKATRLRPALDTYDLQYFKGH